MSLFLRAFSANSVENSMGGNSEAGLEDEYLKIAYTPEFAINYDEETELFNDECKIFMSKYVDEVFLKDGNIPQEEKAKFGLLMQHAEGRFWFGKFIDTQRVHNQEVHEFIFYRLVQYFAVCLFECYLSDDFAPATSIMNMCFTYFHTSTPLLVSGQRGQPSKVYVYEYLKDQSIWKSLRFWNAAFLVAIHRERTKRTGGIQGWSTWNLEQRKDFETSEENSAFAHLASFLYMMKSLGVSKKDRDEFLVKMSVIGNLREEQISTLQDSVEIL